MLLENNVSYGIKVIVTISQNIFVLFVDLTKINSVLLALIVSS